MNYFPRARHLHPVPQPGEIWKIHRSLQYSMDFTSLALFSKTAQSYIEGEGEDRYVMIVKEPETLVENDDSIPEISAMILSLEIQHLSHLDILLPSHISGLDFDLLAETWHVLRMLTSNLTEPIGNRLSRSIYDILLSIGDQDPLKLPHHQEIEAVGLKINIHQSAQNIFHQQENDWSDVLLVPVAIQQTYIEAMNAVEQITQIEQDIIITKEPQVSLNKWLKHQFEGGWLAVSEVLNPVVFPGGLIVLGGIRSLKTAEKEKLNLEILNQLIQQLAPEYSTQQQKQAAGRLGEIAPDYQPAIESLIQLMNTTTDNEVFWTAVTSLRLIMPDHPASGIRRIKRIDMGTPIARQPLAFDISIVPKMQKEIAVLLQVYPLNHAPYLPAQLRLSLLDDAEQVIRTVTAQLADFCIQLKLTGQVGEKFKVQIAGNESNFTENFLL
jgi:hypothetical protein